MIQKWRFLKAGDIVDIVAPAFRCKEEELLGARQYLEDLGLTPRIPTNLFSPHYLFSNDDMTRSEQLKAALWSRDSKAVWCLRGGYGTARTLLPLIKHRAPRLPKLVVGLSDITVLHLFINQKWNWASLHGPLLDRIGGKRIDENVKRQLSELLFGRVSHIEFPNLEPLNSLAKRKVATKGKILGTNLVLVEASIKTPWEFKGQNKILFVEDIDERGYKIDRALHHLLVSGAFKGLKGLVFGEFTGGKEPTGESLVDQTLENFALEVNFPVWKGLPSGHGILQFAVPLNTSCEIRGRRMSVEVGGKI